jgi:NAD(P)-dependent dehydrogenase (short-subunit alcohol dehydrogenase family)
VTGGRRGIGRGIVLALAEAGFNIVVNDLALDDQAEETLAGCRQRGAEACFAAGDVADLAGHERLVEQAWEAFGGIHCLVNNAGVSVARRGDLLDVEPDSYDRVMSVNLRGPFFLTQRVARRMVAEAVPGRPRSIVNISSFNADAAAVERGEYCLSKTGVSMMTRLYALRLADHGIGVHEIRPGIIRTDMTAVAREKYDPLIAGGISPIRRWGEPEDIGRAVAALASGAFAFSTGDAYYVDGGLHIARL